MKKKLFIKKFVQNLEQFLEKSKDRGSLSENDVTILKDCLELCKDAHDTKDKELENILILEVTKKFLLLTNHKKFNQLIN
jgi:hypothetical protein